MTKWLPVARNAGKLGLLSESQFFQAVSEVAGHMDPESVKNVYIAMLAVVHHELRTKGALRFPQLIDMYVINSNEHGKAKAGRLTHKEVRVRTSRAVKNYFKQMEIDSPGTLVAADDRLVELGVPRSPFAVPDNRSQL